MRLSEHLNQHRSLEGNHKLDILHNERRRLTSKLLQSEPLHFKHHLHLAAIHYSLGYSDLAAGDAYKALTLLETFFDPDFSDFHPEVRNGEGETVPWPEDEQAILDAKRDMAECLWCLVLALTDLGCLRDAYTYLLQLDKLDQERLFFTEKEYQKLQDSILRVQNTINVDGQGNGGISRRKIEAAQLRDFGFARREIYGWNNYEPKRSSPDTIQALNKMLMPGAPHLEVRTVELPVLDNFGEADRFPCSFEQRSSTAKLQDARPAISVQVGLFAKTDLPPASRIHHEPSVLTAVRPLDASLCHNCGVGIPEPSSTASDCLDEPICCLSCAEAAVFCSHACLNIAQTRYHTTTCGNEEVDPLGRVENSHTPSEDLYFLLLARTFAMSHSQNTHPLELPETKYLWGHFAQELQLEHETFRSLPFTFHHNIVLPFRLLSVLSEEHPEMSPFSPRGIHWYDTWVVQTLYAKFRGVASARQSTWDGKPEVAAVHPLWCLANHSCAPNVEWGWESERMFHVRDRPVSWGDQKSTSVGEWKGIKAGEEILTHYCDMDLSVKDRREYMLGSLGGECKCDRCVWEAGQEA
jgi:hypothetical protein